MSVRWIGHVWSSSPYEGKRLLLHLALADFANDEGECWPSVRTLARKSRSSRQWVLAGLRDMVGDGLLEVMERGGGRGNSSRYRLLTPEGSTDLPITNGSSGSRNGSSGSTQSVKSVTSPTTYRTVSDPSITADQFNVFWLAYPRKVGKGLARRAFVKAMASPTAPTMDTLLSAIQRYEQSVSDRKYLAHPTTWLNGERWLDETEPQPVRFTDIPQHHREAMELGAQYATAGYTLDQLLESAEHMTDEQRQLAVTYYHKRRGA